MFKLSTTFIVLGFGIGTAATVKQVVRDLLHDLDQVSLTMATVPVIRPTTANVVSSTLAAADRLVQSAKDLNVSSQHVNALAQDAASDCDGSTCMEVMIAVWGPAWTGLRLMRAADLGTNG